MKLDNKKIYDALILGAHNVMNQKELLNSINVFPIQDNDTGNNLSAMMQSIIYKAKLDQTIDETLNSVAEAALSGSIDSYLGVLLQAKYKDLKSGKIAEIITNTEQFILISGKKMITNNAVNFIMVLTISLTTYIFLVM